MPRPASVGAKAPSGRWERKGRRRGRSATALKRCGLPPGLGLHAEGQAVVVTGIDGLAGRLVTAAVPLRVGGEHADLRARPEAVAGRPLLGQGELLQVAGAFAVGLRIDPVVTELQRGAHHVAPLVHRAHAEAGPGLPGVVVDVAVLVALPVTNLDVIAQAQHALLAQEQHIDVTVPGPCAPPPPCYSIRS